MFIRFSPQGSTAPEFYRQRLGLPLIRVVGNGVADIYWGGECSIYEIVFVKDRKPTPEPSHESAASVPIFRVHNLDDVRRRWTALGVAMTPTVAHGKAREAYVADPDGYWIGFRQVDDASTDRYDVEARNRRRRGEAFNPGCKSMPEGVQEVGWLIRRVADVAAMTRFYQDSIGLKRIADEGGRVRFDLGDNVILELTGGGSSRPPPTDRYHGSSAILFRVSDVSGFRSGVVAGGGKIVNEKIPLHWAELTYTADPEGAVIGAEQAYHPGTYAPEKFVLPENLEAERRWREHCAAHPD